MESALSQSCHSEIQLWPVSEKDNNGWNVQVRRFGCTKFKTFKKKTDAQSWANEIELRLERGEPVSPPRHPQHDDQVLSFY